MSKSITYYLTLFVIRVKGIKKAFSQDSINYQAISKGDVHIPKNDFFSPFKTTKLTIQETLITEIRRSRDSKKLLLYIHGGAFISGPAMHHWASIRRIAKKRNHTF